MTTCCPKYLKVLLDIRSLVLKLKHFAVDLVENPEHGCTRQINVMKICQDLPKEI